MKHGLPFWIAMPSTLRDLVGGKMMEKILKIFLKVFNIVAFGREDSFWLSAVFNKHTIQPTCGKIANNGNSF